MNSLKKTNRVVIDRSIVESMIQTNIKHIDSVLSTDNLCESTRSHLTGCRLGFSMLDGIIRIAEIPRSEEIDLDPKSLDRD